MDEWKFNHKSIGYKDTNKMLTDLKKYPEYSWLKEVDSTALQQSLRDLQKAYDNFFAKRAKYAIIIMCVKMIAHRGEGYVRYKVKVRDDAPDGVLYLTQKYHLDPETTYYVGDRKLDVLCAKNAGVKSILFLEEGSCVEPTGLEDLVVHELTEIVGKE